MINGIHHVSVHVHDLPRMLKFYSEAFGFKAPTINVLAGVKLDFE